MPNENSVQIETFTDLNGRKYSELSFFHGISEHIEVSGGFLMGAAGGPWLSCIEQMGKWYEQNIHTYQGTTAKPRKGKTPYSCPLIGGKNVYDDCSGFVQACLLLAGIDCPLICTATMQDGSVFAKLMDRSGFQHFSGNFTPENSQVGDILCGGPQTHTEIYAGNRKSWSWGNIHDGQNGHSGMPCGFCGMSGRGGYIHCWRKMG